VAHPQWYYLDGDQTIGPVPESTIRERMLIGHLRPQDLVWREGMQDWQPIKELPELQTPVPGSPPPMPTPAPAAPPTEPYAGGMQPPRPMVSYGGFWRRFVAFVIDSFVMIAANAFVGFFIGIVAGIAGLNENAIFLISYPISIVTNWLYYAILQSSPLEATLGKLALGMRVTDLNGNRISFARATGRYFAKLLSGAILLIGYIMAGFTEKKQALHDMLAGTLVVNR
jgi:uncharacterized RDD family membrane protein YckC